MSDAPVSAESPVPSDTPSAPAGAGAAPVPGGGRLGPVLARLPEGLALGAFLGLVVKDLDLAALTPFEGPREALVVLVALAAAASWLAGLRRTLLTACLVAVALWAVVAFTPLCPALASGLVQSEVVEPSDAVLVSAAALSPGEPARGELRSRLLRGVELVARGKAPLLVVFQGEAMRAEDAAELMELLGVGAEKLVTLPGGGSTHDEAVAVARLSRERSWRLVAAVTSPLHSSRMGAALVRQGVNVVLVPSLETRFDALSLGRASDRVAAFGTVIHEQMGLLVYRLRGWV
jgi:uncharacterized SAM-binding protein YcdF (DUF218 family)